MLNEETKGNLETNMITACLSLSSDNIEEISGYRLSVPLTNETRLILDPIALVHNQEKTEYLILAHGSPDGELPKISLIRWVISHLEKRGRIVHLACCYPFMVKLHYPELRSLILGDWNEETMFCARPDYEATHQVEIRLIKSSSF
jgi:hypothetical protein